MSNLNNGCPEPLNKLLLDNGYAFKGPHLGWTKGDSMHYMVYSDAIESMVRGLKQDRGQWKECALAWQTACSIEDERYADSLYQKIVERKAK